MKYRYALIMYIICFLLQPFLYNLFPSFSSHASLLLCLTAVLTFVYDDAVPGILFGFIFSLFGDIFYGMYAGPGALCLVLTAAVIWLLRGFANIENIINAVLNMIFATWLYATLYWVVYSFTGSPYSYLYAMKSLPLQFLFNTVIGTGLYLVLIQRVIKHKRDRYFK
ncbi:MAG: hypothetical protein ACI4LA_04890 [Emergencia sp.]